MNFFAALSIFHIVTPSVDVTPLPMIATTYLLDSVNVAIPWSQSRWQVKSAGLLENIVVKHSFGTSKLDTAMTYIQLNSDNNPIKYTSTPNEQPIQKGTEFLYTGKNLVQRLQYDKGARIYTTDYQYANNLLVKIITADSIGPFDTTLYKYTDDKLSEIESKSRNNYVKTKYVYFGTDTISSQEFNASDVASNLKSIWIMKGDLIVKENKYDKDKLFGFTLFENQVPTSLTRRLNSHSQASGTLDAPTRDILGRKQNYLLGVEAKVASGRNFK
jgi:hypothetical protein